MSNHDTQPFQPPDGEIGSALRTRIERLLSPRFRIEKRLGAGAMGAVFLARDHTLERRVAIKLSRLFADAKRQEREARSLARVQSPHIVTVYDFLRLEEDEACVVMEFVEGEDLSARLSREGPPEIGLAQKWMLQVARGMAVVGQEGVVHRDVKPANILVDQRDDAFVTDFGIAHSSDFAQSTEDGRILGTPYYIAPEQAEDSRGVDTRCDIYSFGATFYHVLTGHPPFQSKSILDLLLKHKIEPLIPPSNVRETIPTRINDCIERCLAKLPTDRFQDFEEVESVLSATPGDHNGFGDTDERIRPFLELYRLHRDALLASGASQQRVDIAIDLPHGRALRLLRGDLVEQQVEAIASSDDGYFTMGGGVSAAIRRAGGEQIEQDAAKYVPARQGRVVVTPAGALPARYIFHGVTIGVDEGPMQMPSRDIIAEIVDSCLYHVETFSLRSIAFPLLGSGTGRLPRETALDTIVEVLCRRLVSRPTPLIDIRVVIGD